MGRSQRALRIVLLGAIVVVALALWRERLPRDQPRFELLMSGTEYETPLFVLDSGLPGPSVLVLAGIHGDEPGPWLAARELLKRDWIERGRLLVIPWANVQAIEARVRSTPELGDLNRLYFGDPDVFPMARMAQEIVDAVERHDVRVVLDLHESWGFYDETEEDVNLAALGQTISPHRSEPSRSLAAGLVAATNELAPGPDFHYHEFPAGHVDALIVPLPAGVSDDQVPRKSAIDLPGVMPGLASILVEVGQQQPLERRVRQGLAVVRALLAVLDRS